MCLKPVAISCQHFHHIWPKLLSHTQTRLLRFRKFPWDQGPKKWTFKADLPNTRKASESKAALGQAAEGKVVTAGGCDGAFGDPHVSPGLETALLDATDQLSKGGPPRPCILQQLHMQITYVDATAMQDHKRERVQAQGCKSSMHANVRVDAFE